MKGDNEQRIQNQFGAFCVRVLKNEAARVHNEYTKQREREKSLNEMTSDEMLFASMPDKYFSGEHVFQVLGKPVVVTGDLLAEAIASLPENKRDVILLFYFLGMNDREISEKLNVVRQAIAKRRVKTLKELYKYLEKEGFDWLDM
jgi:DNA-directed RNA polymerase specialized sigma subunit, sigma24 homolog